MVKIQEEKINVLHYIELLKRNDAGSVIAFLGEPRRSSKDGKVISIKYTAYKSMVINEMKKIEKEALSTNGIKDVVIVHRIGNVSLKEISLFVGISSAHRGEGFKVCNMVVDKIKEGVPIWKEIKYEGSRNS